VKHVKNEPENNLTLREAVETIRPKPTETINQDKTTNQAAKPEKNEDTLGNVYEYHCQWEPVNRPSGNIGKPVIDIEKTVDFDEKNQALTNPQAKAPKTKSTPTTVVPTIFESTPTTEPNRSLINRKNITSELYPTACTVILAQSLLTTLFVILKDYQF
jgi:hypothetical protein